MARPSRLRRFARAARSANVYRTERAARAVGLADGDADCEAILLFRVGNLVIGHTRRAANDWRAPPSCCNLFQIGEFRPRRGSSRQNRTSRLGFERARGAAKKAVAEF